jgi:hypothetical protein
VPPAPPGSLLLGASDPLPRAGLRVDFRNTSQCLPPDYKNGAGVWQKILKNDTEKSDEDENHQKPHHP